MTFNPQPKPTRWKCIPYENWVRKQGCIVCGAQGEVHHSKGIGNLSGTALKAPSWACMCICRYHHNAIHNWMIDKELQLIWIAKTLGKAIEEGILVWHKKQ